MEGSLLQSPDYKMDALFSVTPKDVQRMLESAPADGERGLPCHSQRVQHIAAGICQDVQLSEKSSQDSDISWPSLDLNTPQDALQQQLAEMQDDLQHAWDVNEDLQAKLEATERSSAEHSSRVSLDLYYAVQKAETEVKVADKALGKMRDQEQSMKFEMRNKEAELLYQQAKAAAHQQNLEAAQAQHAQEERAMQMQLKQERIRAEKAEDKAEEAKGRADKAEGYLNEANAQVDNLERQLNNAFERMRKVAIGIHRAINPHQEGKGHWAGSLRTAKDEITRMRLLLEGALAHIQEVPESPGSLAYNDACSLGVLSPTRCSPSSSLSGSPASTLPPISPFVGVLQQMKTPSPESPATVLCSPSRHSSRRLASGAGVVSPWSLASTPEHLWDTSTLTPPSTLSVSSMEMLSPDMAAQRVVGSPLAGQLVANPMLSPWSHASTPEHLWDTSTLTPASTCSLSPLPSRGSMSAGGALLWKLPSPAATFTQEPSWDTPSHTTPCSSSSASSACWSDSCASPTSWSTCSSFERALQQMVTTPSPATAAAMVRTPPAASPGLMETPGPESPAAVLCSSSSGQLVRIPCSDSATAALFCNLSSSSRQRLAAPLLQDSGSSGSSHGYIGDCSPPAPGFFPPAHTLFCESVWESSSCESVWASPSSSSNSVTSLSQSSSLSGSPDSWLSAMSPFERVLQQMVATPSPATAAAMVRSPMPSSRQLVAAPGPRKAAVVRTPPSDSAAPRVRSPFAGQQLAAPGQDMAASRVSRPSSGQLVAALTPNSTAVRGHCPPSAQSVPSPGPDRNTAAREASRPLSSQKLATTSAFPPHVSPGGPPFAVHSPTFSGSPVAGLCRSGLTDSCIRVRTTKKQQARQEAVAQRIAITSSGPPHDAAPGTTPSPTAGLDRVASVKRRPSVRSGSKSLASKHNSSCGKENSPLLGKVATPSLGQPETPFQSKVETPVSGNANTPAKVAGVELFSPALTATGTANAPFRTPLTPMSGVVNSAPGMTPQALQFHHVAVPFWGLHAPAATVEDPVAAATLPTVAASRFAPPVASSSAISSRQMTTGGQSADSQAASTTADAAKGVRPRGSKRRTASAAAPVASQMVTRSQAAAQKHVERMQTRSMQNKRFK